jgi:Spy/CpxP family protein refolding chaperone
MRKIQSIPAVVLLGALLILTTSIGMGQRMSVEDRVKGLKDSLKLSDTQVEKITKIFEDQREEMTAAFSEHQGDRDAMRSVMEELMKKTDAKVKTVLTAKQAVKYEEMMKARRANMGRRPQGGGF